MTFLCEKCGLCCMHLEQILQLKDFDSGNGRCIYLMDNNECLIYEDRPDVCNVGKMYELYQNQMTEEAYIAANVQGCMLLKAKYGNVT